MILRRSQVLCFALFTLLCCVSVFAQSQDKNDPPLQPFTIATFQYVEDIEWRNTSHIRFFKELMARHGFDLQMLFLPGKRALRNVELGLIDAELGRGKGTTAISQHLFESSFAFTSICLRRVYRAGDIVLEPKTVGFQTGAQVIEGMLRKRWPQAKPVPYISFEQSVKMLASTRVDMVLLPHIGEEHIRQLNIIEFDIEPLFELPLHFIVGDRYRHLMPEFEVTAKELLPQYPGVSCQ